MIQAKCNDCGHEWEMNSETDRPRCSQCNATEGSIETNEKVGVIEEAQRKSVREALKSDLNRLLDRLEEASPSGSQCPSELEIEYTQSSHIRDRLDGEEDLPIGELEEIEEYVDEIEERVEDHIELDEVEDLKREIEDLRDTRNTLEDQIEKKRERTATYRETLSTLRERWTTARENAEMFKRGFAEGVVEAGKSRQTALYLLSEYDEFPFDPDELDDS